MINKMIRRMTIKDFITRGIAILCIIAVLGWIAWEVFYIRIYDASKPTNFPFVANETVLTNGLEQLQSASQKTEFDIIIDNKALIHVATIPDYTAEEIEKNFRTRFSSGEYIKYKLDTTSPTLIAARKWEYTHVAGLYNTIFHYNANRFYWFNATYPTKADRTGKPHYRYYTTLNIQKANYGYTLNIFCKNPDLINQYVYTIVEQINQQVSEK